MGVAERQVSKALNLPRSIAGSPFSPRHSPSSHSSSSYPYPSLSPSPASLLASSLLTNSFSSSPLSMGSAFVPITTTSMPKNRQPVKTRQKRHPLRLHAPNPARSCNAGDRVAAPGPTVTYSLSPLSEAIAPMRTVRLTRDKNSDSETILKNLKGGDLTICPEGTPCREPYLLRFSPLFAELADEIVPVALEASAGWFYGTTASGLKLFDPFLYFMNPMPRYRVKFLDWVPKEMTCVGGGWSGSDVANRIQKQLGDAMGYKCTNLTRRDKYMHDVGKQ